MSDRHGRVQTVLGLVEPDALGHTQTHEHLLCDARFFFEMPGVREAIEALPEERRAHVEQPIRFDNLDWIRRNGANINNLQLSDVSEAIQELNLYKAAGGGTIVEATSIGYGRRPDGLKAISEATGIHVVMGAGYHLAQTHPPMVGQASITELAEQMAHDVLEGADNSDIKAGIIGEVALSWPAHPDEEKVLHAAVAAQTGTGVALLIHPGFNPSGPLAAIDAVRAADGNPERVVMSHVDLRLFSLDQMLTLAKTGCYIEFDLFGYEWSLHPWGPIDVPNDAKRIEYLIDLIASGYGHKLVISQDVSTKVHLRKYGGEGYSHILETVVPIMRAKGMRDEEIDAILVDNPMRVLTIP